VKRRVPVVVGYVNDGRVYLPRRAGRARGSAAARTTSESAWCTAAAWRLPWEACAPSRLGRIKSKTTELEDRKGKNNVL
jgi:hypothetical protein